MYFEKAIVKTYYRNYENNKKVPFNQVYLGNAEDSEFNKNPEEPDEVAVIKILDFEDLANNNGLTKLNELEAKYNELQEENLQLKQQIEELNSTAKSLASDVNELTKEKLQLQEDLLTAKDKIEGNDKDIIQLQKEHKQELKEATDKVEKLLILINSKDKDIVYLAERGLTKRIINNLPERIESLVRTVKESEAEVHEEQKE